MNNSTNEFYFVQNLFIGTVAGDSDGDGMPDLWELQNFGNLASGAGGDNDGDGQSNVSEFSAGTHPANPSSVLRIESYAVTTASTSLTFRSVIGKNYRAQWARGLTGWTDIGSATGQVGTATTTITGLPAPAVGESHWFYRIRTVP